ncbi:MAG: hypothetical protein AAB512_05230 [Patescibacteria group bacterium]
MKLLIKLALVLTFFVTILFGLSTAHKIPNVSAATCNLALSTTTVTGRDDPITVTLSGLDNGQSYEVMFGNANAGRYSKTPSDGSDWQFTTTLNTIGYKGGVNSQLAVGAVRGTSARPNESCTPGTIIITVGSGSTTPGSCTASISGTDITIVPSSFSVNTHTVNLVGVFAGNFSLGNMDNDRSGAPKTTIIPVPTSAPDGRYQVMIDYISPVMYGTSCGFIDLNGPPPGDCEADPQSCNPCSSGTCETGIGPLNTNLKQFAEQILGIATGMAGGIALILMVIGAIRVLMSSGDQQKLNGGREMIVSALAGLLFLVFAVLILRFIGISIMGL